jgi:hypothetical protein
MADSAPTDQQKLDDAIKQALEQANNAVVSTPAEKPIESKTESKSIDPVPEIMTPPIPPPPEPMIKKENKTKIDNFEVQRNSASATEINADNLVSSLIQQTDSIQIEPKKVENRKNMLSEDKTTYSVPPSNKSKKKKGMSILIAGLLMLLISLPVAVYYISQRNNLTEQRSCAAGDGECTPGPYAGTNAPTGTCNSPDCCQNWGNKTCFWKGAAVGGHCMCTSDTCASGGWSGWGACHLDSCKCVEVQYCGDGLTYQIRGCSGCGSCNETSAPTSPPGPPGNPSSPPGSTHTPTPRPGSTNTPTPIIGSCRNIKIYLDGEVVNDLTTLKPGNNIVIAVAGVNATAGMIRVNSGNWHPRPDHPEDPPLTKNSQGEFILPFTIPDGTTYFVIESEVLVNGIWQ